MASREPRFASRATRAGPPGARECTTPFPPLQNRDAGAAASVAARWAWLEAPGVGDNTTFCGTELINGTALGALVGGVALEVGARDVAVIRLTPGSAC